MPAGLLRRMACAVLWLHHSSSLVSTARKTKLVELACCNTFALVRLTFLRWFRCPWSHSSSTPPAVAVAAVVMLLCTQAGNLWLRRRVTELMPIKIEVHDAIALRSRPLLSSFVSSDVCPTRQVQVDWRAVSWNCLCEQPDRTL